MVKCAEVRSKGEAINKYNLPIVVITVIEYSRAPEKFHGLSEMNVLFKKS